MAALAVVPLVFLAIFFAWPVAAMAVRGLAPGGHVDLGGFTDVLTRPRILRVLWFTVWMAALATVSYTHLTLPTICSV